MFFFLKLWSVLPIAVRDGYAWSSNLRRIIVIEWNKTVARFIPHKWLIFTLSHIVL